MFYFFYASCKQIQGLLFLVELSPFGLAIKPRGHVLLGLRHRSLGVCQSWSVKSEGLFFWFSSVFFVVFYV